MMSSHAAAAISSMITSQVYPQYRWPAHQPRRPVSHPSRRAPSQHSAARSMFLKGHSKAIGLVQIVIGIAVLVVTCLSLYNNTNGFFVVSALCLVSGWVSLIARGKKMIRAAFLANIASFVASFLCIIVYSYIHFSTCWWCDISDSEDDEVEERNPASSYLWVLLALSGLNLLVTTLSVVYAWKSRHRGSSRDAITARQEGWRDGLRSPTGENMLMSTITLAAQPKGQQP